MTSRDVTIAGFVVLSGVAAALVVFSWLRGDRLARFGTAVAAVCRRHVVLRVVLVLIWAWLGWHFLARTP